MDHDAWAHTAPPGGTVQLLSDHLAVVRDLAQSFAKPLGLDAEAGLAGLLHDYGKYGELFQQRLRDPKRIHGVDHWSEGALKAAKLGAACAALAIQGHHIGLREYSPSAFRQLEYDVSGRNPSLGLRMSSSNPGRIADAFAKDGFGSVSIAQRERMELKYSSHSATENMLDVRMVFSCLTDADFMDTEAHFNQDPVTNRKVWRERGLELNPGQALEQVLKAIAQRQAAMEDSSVKRVRQRVFDDCMGAGEEPSGVFTLTAPTGSGKTLAMLTFALKHAAKWEKKRIIVVLPFLTLIEQTANVYRDLFRSFGQDFVVEHHSMAGGDGGVHNDDQDPHYRARLLAENWDAPVIITSTVQFLESLFTDRPGRARKLHNIADSVVLMDEVQTLPVKLAIPTLANLSYLSARYNSTIVLATATQPAFPLLESKLEKISHQRWSPNEIIKDSNALFSMVSRYSVEARHDRQSWEMVAEEIAQSQQVLAVVNLKKHAYQLAQKVSTNVDRWYHLSTNMSPLHRTHVLENVRQDLKDGRPCRLIATQCVEAGVDLDFPTVYRAWGPMDSLAQVAGRCNREGLRPDGGNFVIFLPDDEGYPAGIYKTATSIARDMAQSGLDLNAPATYEEYWRRLYDFTMPDKTWDEVLGAIRRHNFTDVAEHYRLIAHNGIEVLVPYRPQFDDGQQDYFDQLADEAINTGLTRSWLKRARPYTVSLYRPQSLNDPLWRFLEPVGGDLATAEWFICRSDSAYSDAFGLVAEEAMAYTIA